MPRNEEYDWIFDYVLQFLESDTFDCAIMDFVDEKCFVFEDCEENKLVYTEIHKEFCEHVEALINSNLGELGITPEIFFESCERGRAGRDINASVFERLVAMDDFVTFKKLMTKRNLELQLEAMQHFQQQQAAQSTSAAASLSAKMKSSLVLSPAAAKTPRRAESKRDDDNDNDSDRAEQKGEEDYNTAGFEALIDPEELLALKEAQLLDLDEAQLDETEMQELLLQSLIEMEMIHRQEELEHAELERALMLSLAAEEERLLQLVSEKTSESDSERERARDVAEEKVSSDALRETAKAEKEDKDDKFSAESISAPSAVSPAHSASTPAKKKPTVSSSAVASAALSPAQMDAFADIKPLKLKPLRAALPLPSLSLAKAVAGDSEAEKLVSDLEDKRRAAEQALKLSQAQLQAQKAKEEELRKTIINGIDPQEAERRAQHMREQRELLLAKKKAERERKVAAEEERKKRALEDAKSTESNAAAAALSLASSSSPQKQREEESKGEEEMKRAMLRAALAQRLKMDLLDDNNTRGDAKTSTQNPLRQLDQLREDSKKRDVILHKQVQKTQELIRGNN